MITQPLLIDEQTLVDSRRAAEANGLTWSAYAARAIRRQAIRDNLRRAAADVRDLSPEDAADYEAFSRERAASTAQRWAARG